MKGAVAAGHRVTAEAGARVLAEGGHAVDACIAAGFASWVAESPLTGPGGGGFILVHRASDDSTRLLDFFVEVPGRGLEPHAPAAMESVDVEFDRDPSQVLRIGAASCAVPGPIAGLAAYRVISRRPVRTAFRGHEFVSNPPPSSGGLLIGYGLLLLDRLGSDGEPGSAEAISALVEAMREQTRARQGRFATDLHRGGL